MKHLCPATTYTLAGNKLVLFDPTRFEIRRGVTVNGPIRLAKTFIKIETRGEWSLYLDQGIIGGSILLFSADEQAEEGEFEMTKLLGFKISVMPWQKLILVTEEEAWSSGICYAELDDEYLYS